MFGAMIEQIVRHGATLLLGSTILLTLGVLAMSIQPGPFARRWVGVRVAIATTVYLVSASIPLPRWTSDRSRVASVPIERSAPIAVPADDAPPPEFTHVLPVAVRRSVEDYVDRSGRAYPAMQSDGEGPGVDWRWTIAVAWAIGVLVRLLWLGLGWWRLSRTLCRVQAADPDEFGPLCLPPRTRIAFAAEPVRPFCYGVLRRVVVVSERLRAPARRADLLAVLRHECAHLRARDPAVQTLFSLLSLPLFFHPLLRWVERRVRFDSEVLADACAVDGSDATDYVRSLVGMVDPRAPKLAQVVLMFRRRSEFFRRMHMLLERESDLPRSMSRTRRFTHSITLGLALMACGAALGVTAGAQEPAADPARALREENVALRAEIAELRAMLARLSDAVAKQADVSAEEGGEAVGAVDPTAVSTSTTPTPQEDPQPAGQAKGASAVRDLLPLSYLVMSASPSAPGSDSDRLAGSAAAREPGAGADLSALVDLGVRLVDLEADVKLAEAEMAALTPLIASGRGSLQDQRQIEIRLSASKRKQQFVRAIVDDEYAGARAALKRARVLNEQGLASSAEVDLLQRRIRLLSSLR